MLSKQQLFSLVIAALVALGLSSCSGPKNRCTTNCGGGNSTLNLVLTDTPPTGVTILSFPLQISGISLTPSSGSDVSVYSGGTFELTRLQSDTSGVAAQVAVPDGTYTAVNFTIGTSSGYFINNSGATIGTCVNGAVCALPAGAAATVTATFSSLTFSGNNSQFLSLDINLNKAITATNGITVDFKQASVLTVSTVAPTGTLPSGDTAYIDDFAGAVTSVSTSAITVQSSVRGSLTAVVSSSTTVLDPQLLCGGGTTATLSCIKTGAIVSFQGVLSSAGIITATSLDVIDNATSPKDEVEGTIYPSTCNGGSNFGLILSDSSISSSNSAFAGTKIGQPVCLTVSPTATFDIDTGILTGQPNAPSATSAGFRNANDLLAGQTVRAKISSATSGTNVINATASAMILRFSRLNATVNTVASPAINVTGYPTYITAYPATAQLFTYPSATLLENVTDINNLQSPNSISFSALLLNPAQAGQNYIHVAKIRLE